MEFWGIIGSSDLSDIALDDIKLIPGECDTYPPEAAVVPTTTPAPPTSPPPYPPEAAVVPTTTPAPPTSPPPSGTQSCDFESDFCDFVQSTDDDFDWRRGQGSTSTSGTGPSYDHTRGDALGSYIYTEGFFINRRHHLESRLFPSTMISCITFWYHMWGSTMGDLNVYGKEGTALGQPLWTREGSLGDQWFEAQVQYAPKANYKIVFEGLTGSGQQSDMALDDIDIQPGYCPMSETCTFENPDICTFKQDFDDEYDWTWFNGPTPTLYTGPSVDVTYGTSSGHYVYASAYERLEGDRARLQSREIIHDTDQTEYCVSFYYHMFGTEMGTLNIRLIEGNQELSTPLWTQGTEDLSDHWYMGEVSLSSALTFRVVFEAIRGSGDMSDIAIDDVTISNEVCHGLGDCDFESGSCPWVNIDRDDLDWITQQGSAGQSGPTVDHTLGEAGHYLLVDSLIPAAIGLQAHLMLGAPSLTGVKCLQFWYMMYGMNMGQLLVYTSQASDLANRDLVWMLEGQQSQSSTEWKQASVPVNFNQVDDLFLVAVLGSTSYSNIAVDDLNILNGNCNLNPASALPGSTNSLLDCNFEKTFCYWNQDLTDDYQWTLWTKATGTNETGPSSDPNSETGWYVYAEADMVLPGSKARLLSPLEHESAEYTETCLEFYYHMFGADMGNLYVYIERTDLNETEMILKRGGSDQGNNWYVAQVNIGIEPGVGFYRLIFEAVRGGSIYSDIAIDEIKYHNGSCPPLKTCGFESNVMCGWKNEILYDMFDWSRNTASSLRPDLGDHTNGVSSGYLIYANQGIPRVPGDFATLLSPTYSATATGDCFSFWYHIHGESDVGRLRVYERVDGNLEGPYWSSTGVNEGDNWWKASVTLKSKSQFQIAVVGDVGNDPNSELAIDDFKVEEQPCAPRGSCDFEKDYCSWMNDVSGDDEDWVRLNGASTGGGTGPVKDHTLGAMLGSFLYTDSVVFAAGEKAWLLSEVYQAGDACLSFWIHMNGPGNKTLNLYTEDQSNYVKDLTWTRSGNLGDRWVQGLVSLSNPDVYRIIIEALYDDDDDGSIALDDTMLAEGGLCNESSVANCDFEDDMCGYEQADDDDFDWTRNQWRTPSDNTGPTYDHTTMTSEGWYMYMESSSPNLQDMETRLISPLIDLTTRLCLHFWYHMFGREVGTLNVLTLRKSAKPSDIGSVVWTRSGQVGDQWMAGTLVVGEPESFRVGATLAIWNSS
nr:MAM and LDL-receptor class A domain-containing protein 1-like [Lytechinus pictus]